MNFSELKSKEVVRLQDGKKLGFIDDLIIDESTNRIVAFKIPKQGRMFKKTEYLEIEVSQIDKIGENVILICDNMSEVHIDNPKKEVSRGEYYYSPKVFKRLDEKSKNSK